MYNPYDFHSMSKQYREEALRDARARHLEGWLRTDRRARSKRSRAGRAGSHVLASLLCGARLASQLGRRSEDEL
jgi:hypothetical protein